MKFIFRMFAKVTAALSVWLYFLPRVKRENKNASLHIKGSAIIVTNHKNAWDFLLMELLFLFRYIRCLVGKLMYECNPFITFALKNLGAIKVDQYSFNMDFFHEAMDVLEKGGVVLIFPEGHFSLDGKIMPFQQTTALLAVQSGVPVIPLYHSSDYGLFHPTKVAVGEPINLRSFCSTTNPDSEKLRELTMILQNKVTELRSVAEK